MGVNGLRLWFHFTELLRKDNSVAIHQRKLKLLVKEMFKVKIGVAPAIKKGIFEMDNRITIEVKEQRNYNRKLFFCPPQT